MEINTRTALSTSIQRKQLYNNCSSRLGCAIMLWFIVEMKLLIVHKYMYTGALNEWLLLTEI